MFSRIVIVVSESESESESALFAKCVQTHEEFVVVFKKLIYFIYLRSIWGKAPKKKKNSINVS